MLPAVMKPRAASFLVLVAAAASAAAADPDRAAGLNAKGLELSQARRFEEAVRAFAGALEAAPGDETIRRNLGRCEANWGVALLEKGDLLSAEQATRRARDILPEDAVIRLNLAACLEERGYPVRAATEVAKAVELAPELGSAHDRLASIHYREGRLDEAIASWESAARLVPSDAAVRERLQRAKAAREAEAGLSRQTSAHVEILFDMRRDAVLASKVLAAMEEAHGVVGADLQAFGQERLVVVLLPHDAFQAVTGAHSWVGGLYDGRIRLPVKDAAQRESELLARARHEYVHSVLAPLGKRAPGWLHEGLAQVYEGRSAAQAKRRLLAGDPLDFAALSQSFAATRSAERARAQYDTALAFVDWLRAGERGGAFRAAMKALFADEGLEQAFESAYGKPLAALYDAMQASLPR